MHFTTTVTLHTDETPSCPLPGIRVALFDRDLLSDDDPLGSALTDEQGDARFLFSAADFADLDDRIRGAAPDLYVIVHDASGNVVLSTRAEAAENAAQKRINVRVPRGVAVQHSLFVSGEGVR